MSNGHKIVHNRVKLSEFYFNNDSISGVNFYSNKVVYESANCAV